MTPRHGSALAVAAGLGVLACSSAAPEPARPRPRPSLDARPAFDTPARWALYPEAPGTPTAELVLDDGRCLVLTDTGERWLVEPAPGGGDSQRCSGRGRAAGHTAVDALRAVQRRGARFRFVGEGGALYEADEPLGPFVRASRPPRPLVTTSAGTDTVLGLDESGGTWLFDEGWRTLALPGGARGHDLFVGPDGRALWLGLPEQLLVSTDGGRSFVAPSPVAPAIGALALGRSEGGDPAVRGLVGALVWKSGGLVPEAAAVESAATLHTAIDPEPGPRALRVHAGEAALAGRRYVELRRGEGEAERAWTLREGELGGALRDTPVEGLDCEAATIAATMQHTVVGCMSEDAESGRAVVELLALESGARRSLAKLEVVSFADVALAVGGDGSVLVAGACGPAATPTEDGDGARATRSGSKRARRDDGPCATPSPLWVRRSDEGVEVVRGRAHGATSPLRSPLVAPDGRTLYLLGRTGVNDQAAVFVSRDGGRSYQARTLSVSAELRGELGEAWEEGGGPERIDLEPFDAAHLSVDEQGTLGLPVSDGGSIAWATIAPDGRVADLHRPPITSGHLVGAGARVFAAGYDDDEGTLRAYESTDGGLSFAPVPTTAALGRALDTGDGSTVCSSAGCLLGDELVRVGWDGQLEPPLDLVDDVPPSLAPTLGELTACEPVGTTASYLVGQGDDRGPSPRLPHLSELARGDAAWTTVAIDPARASVDLWSAPMPSAQSTGPGAATSRSLLGRVGGAGEPRPLLVRPQAEGFVALRGPASKPGAPAAKGRLGYDLAWANQLSGALGRSRLELDAPVPMPSPEARGASATPAMLQIAGDGVVFRPLAGGPTTFVDARTKSAIDYPDFAKLLGKRPHEVSSELGFAGGQPWALAIVRPSAEPLGLAIARPGSADLAARSLGPASAELGWLYAPGRVGVAVHTPALLDVDEPAAIGAWLEQGGSLGAPFPLPSLRRALEARRACTRDEARAHPRLVASHFTRSGVMLAPHQREAVLVVDPAGTGSDTWLLSDGAVLHLTPTGPCVAASAAASVRPGSLVVLTGDRKAGWLLEQTTEPTPPEPKRVPASPERARPGTIGAARVALRVRPLSCKLRRDLRIPPELEAKAGDPLTRGRR